MPKSTAQPVSDTLKDESVRRLRLPARDAFTMFVIPLGIVVTAMLVRIALVTFVGDLPPFFTFYLAVVISAWYGGGIAGAVAWLAGLIIGTTIVLSPAAGATPVSTAFAQAFFTTSSSITILLFAHQRRTQAALIGFSAQLEESLAETQAANASINQLNEALRDAMRETHHRVKNNLQVISALIDTQTMDGQPVAAADMDRLKLHVRALASIHEVLTTIVSRADTLTLLSSQATLGRIVNLLMDVMPTVHIASELEDVLITHRQAAALAILLNELVSNAAKHGGARVMVRMKRVDCHAELTVCDDGPGFPESFDTLKHSNTGLDLVRRLAEWDLEGDVQFKNGPDGSMYRGAIVIVRYPVDCATESDAETRQPLH